MPPVRSPTWYECSRYCLSRHPVDANPTFPPGLRAAPHVALATCASSMVAFLGCRGPFYSRPAMGKFQHHSFLSAEGLEIISRSDSVLPNVRRRLMLAREFDFLLGSLSTRTSLRLVSLLVLEISSSFVIFPSLGPRLPHSQGFRLCGSFVAALLAGHRALHQTQLPLLFSYTSRVGRTRPATVVPAPGTQMIPSTRRPQGFFFARPSL